MHSSALLLVLAVLAHVGSASLFGSSKKQAADDQGPSTVELAAGWEYVTSGSTIKLSNPKTNTRLTLPQVSYGTGSQQQAITAYTDASSTKALWTVEQAEPGHRGQPIACQSQVRLVNSDTQHSLHSHANHKAPISGAQEVSGFDGRDSGDLWTVECAKGMEWWGREQPVYLRHVETSGYLQALASKRYRQPISGHLEVSCSAKRSDAAQWVAAEGYYFASVLNENKK
ncbi:hypothetical protein GGI07_005232 [Coemansia sp. Benny D115]|nr:hypothetical protein GGI07_005232 [Coemansia sp. Benny D115]